MISRIGMVDNQFSHLAIAYVADGSIPQFRNRDKQWQAFVPGEIYVIEAVLDNGLQVVTLDFYLQEDKARLAHYRYVGNGEQTEAELEIIRKKAAQRIAELAAPGDVPYNFAMNMDSEASLFCSQAVSYAYQLACEELGASCQSGPLATPSNIGHSYPFPISATKILKKSNGDYVNQLAGMLQLQSEQVFAPADVDLDPQIELVGEWRQFKNIAGRRIHDMIFTKVFQWMEQGNYGFQDDSSVIDELGVVGQVLAIAMEKMPPETPAAFVQGTLLAAYLVESPGLNQLGQSALRQAFNSSAVQNLLNSTDDPEAARQFLNFLKQGMKSFVETDSAPVNDWVSLATNEIQDFALQQLGDDEVLRRMQAVRRLIESGTLLEILSYVGLNKEMHKFRSGYVEKRGFAPTDFVYDRFLEAYRVRACQEYQQNGRVFFHHLFAKDFSGSPARACDTTPLDWRLEW